MSTKKPLYRINLLIFPRFQLALIFMNLAIMLVTSTVVWFQMSRAFSELKLMAPTSGIEAETFNRFLTYHSSTVQTYLLIALVFGIVLSTLLTLFVSHRFAGPMVRLKGYFRSISEGKTPTPRLSFRRGDFLQDLPPVVNEAIDVLEGKKKPTKKAA